MNNHLTNNRWITRSKNSESAKLRLFCLPYAGGSSIIYHGWQNGFSDYIEICALNLPGRGTRITELPYTNLLELTKAIKDGLLPFLDLPFALMGHSMGGTISFELARLLRNLGLPMPVKVFVSACSAPQISIYEKKTYDLPETELIEELRRLNGTPKDILENKELLKILLPVIRGDFTVCQTYTYHPQSPLDIPIVAFRGKNDIDILEHTVQAWQTQTTKTFKYHTLSGDHFFCHSEKDELIQKINNELVAYVEPIAY
jgi:medium-chain acyl-[acyl-carrier-protein] hydrolase